MLLPVHGGRLPQRPIWELRRELAKVLAHAWESIEVITPPQQIPLTYHAVLSGLYDPRSLLHPLCQLLVSALTAPLRIGPHLHWHHPLSRIACSASFLVHAGAGVEKSSEDNEVPGLAAAILAFDALEAFWCEANEVDELRVHSL